MDELLNEIKAILEIMSSLEPVECPFCILQAGQHASDCVVERAKDALTHLEEC